MFNILISGHVSCFELFGIFILFYIEKKKKIEIKTIAIVILGTASSITKKKV